MSNGPFLKKKYLILLGVCGVLVFFDQATKLMIHNGFDLGEELVLIPDFFSFTYVRNYGAAFGVLRDAPEAFRSIFFLLIPPLALIFILAILRGVKDTDLPSIFALSSISGGAVGNFIDRIRFGYVIDFLDFYIPRGFFPLSKISSSWQDYPPARSMHWPAFNIADIAIVSGALLLILIEVKRYREELKSQKEKS